MPAPRPTDTPPAPRRGSLLRTVKAVAWSFIGLRKGSEYQEDIKQLNPLHIVIVGFLGVILFVGTLMLIVRSVV